MSEETTTQEVDEQDLSTGDQELLSLDAMRAELARARKEAAAYRVKAREAEEKAAREADERKRAEMSELERFKADLETEKVRARQAEERAQRTIIQSAAQAAAVRAGVRADALDIVTALLDVDALVVSEDGRVEGLDEAVAEIVKARPYLIKQDTAGRISATSPASAQSGETRTQKIGRLFGGQDNAMFGGTTNDNLRILRENRS